MPSRLHVTRVLSLKIYALPARWATRARRSETFCFKRVKSSVMPFIPTKHIHTCWSEWMHKSRRSVTHKAFLYERAAQGERPWTWHCARTFVSFLSGSKNLLSPNIERITVLFFLHFKCPLIKGGRNTVKRVSIPGNECVWDHTLSTSFE